MQPSTRSEDLPELIVRDTVAWRKWLGSHHEKSRDVWLVVSKKGTITPTRLTYDQALEEALSHGWIDGQAKRNTVIADRLISEGRMHAAGIAEIERANPMAAGRPRTTVSRPLRCPTISPRL